jgi:hypothetical protein
MFRKIEPERMRNYPFATQMRFVWCLRTQMNALKTLSPHIPKSRIHEKSKVSGKDSAMKITLGPLSFDILLFFRLCLPTTVFIGVYMGIFSAFDALLLLIDQITPPSWLGIFIGLAWLLLLILYIVLGVAFTRFVVRIIRLSFGSEERRAHRRMALLSGFPFYACCLLCLMAGLSAGILYPTSPDVCGSIELVSLFGFLCFGLASCGYLLLSLFFLRGSTTMSHQAR